jgi:hypothetical protein
MMVVLMVIMLDHGPWAQQQESGRNDDGPPRQKRNQSKLQVFPFPPVTRSDHSVRPSVLPPFHASVPTRPAKARRGRTMSGSIGNGTSEIPTLVPAIGEHGGIGMCGCGNGGLAEAACRESRRSEPILVCRMRKQYLSWNNMPTVGRSWRQHFRTRRHPLVRRCECSSGQ